MKRSAAPVAEPSSKRRKVTTEASVKVTNVGDCQTEEELRRFNVDQLKAFLISKGFEKMGTKPVLVRRIFLYLFPQNHLNLETLHVSLWENQFSQQPSRMGLSLAVFSLIYFHSYIFIITPTKGNKIEGQSNPYTLSNPNFVVSSLQNVLLTSFVPSPEMLLEIFCS